MKKSAGNENKREKKSREEIEVIESIGEKERKA